MKTRAAALAALALIQACSVEPETQRFEADLSPWRVELAWRHEWTPAPDRHGFELLTLLMDASRRDVDLPIDGQAVTGGYEHGWPDYCPLEHRVEGTVRLLRFDSTQVRARVDAVMRCPRGEPVPLKGEFAFNVKTPP